MQRYRMWQEEMSDFSCLERLSRLRGYAGAYGRGEPSQTPSAEFSTGSLSSDSGKSNGEIGAGRCGGLAFRAGDRDFAARARSPGVVVKNSGSTQPKCTSLKILFKFARGLLRRPLQIKRPHELSSLVHEIDNSGVIHRIVAGIFSWYLYHEDPKGPDDRRDLLIIAGKPDYAGIEAFKIGLQDIWRIAFGVDGHEKCRDLLVRT